jgi:hypothetical protein
MFIQVNTDNHIHGSEALAEDVRATVESSLQYLAGRLSRVEVHIRDENSHKGGDRDIHCTMEGRVEGHQPTAVTHAAAALDDAVDGAAEKLKHALETLFGKLEDR